MFWNRLWWQLDNSGNTLKTTGSYTLNGWIVRYVNCILIKLPLKKKIFSSVKGGMRFACCPRHGTACRLWSMASPRALQSGWWGQGTDRQWLLREVNQLSHVTPRIGTGPAHDLNARSAGAALQFADSNRESQSNLVTGPCPAVSSAGPAVEGASTSHRSVCEPLSPPSFSSPSSPSSPVPSTSCNKSSGC